MRPFFCTLPKSVEEAARVDGCTMLGAFARIMVPVARPGLATAAVFSFIFAWNDLVYSMAFISDSSLWPMTTMINNFQTKYGTQWNSILAFGVCLIIPIVIIFILMQKYIVSGLTAGSSKGVGEEIIEYIDPRIIYTEAPKTGLNDREKNVLRELASKVQHYAQDAKQDKKRERGMHITVAEGKAYGARVSGRGLA